MPKKPISHRSLALILLAADLVGLALSFYVSYLIRFGKLPAGLTAPLIWPIVLTLFSLYVVDVYRRDTQVAGMRAPVRTLLGVTLAGLLSSSAAYLGGYWGTEQFFGRGVFPVALLLFAAWATLWRFFLFRWARQRTGDIRWLVLGTGEAAAQLWNDSRKTSSEAELLFLSTEGASSRAGAPVPPMPVSGTVEELAKWDASRCSGIIVAVPPPLPDDLIQRLMQLRLNGLPVYDLADFYERFWFKVPVLHLHNGWFVFSHGFDLLHSPFGLRAKRALDVMISTGLLLVSAPIMLLVAVLIKLDSRGPVIHRQERVGEGGKLFTIYKFRSMHTDAKYTGPAWTRENDSRVTRIGRISRRIRIDELPQIVNVLKGDMSFVGPRPERPEFSGMLERAIPYYELRQLVRPGITGWAQVMYPYAASMEEAREKLQYDLYYIKNYSLMLDIAILFKTLRVVMLGKGR